MALASLDDRQRLEEFACAIPERACRVLETFRAMPRDQRAEKAAVAVMTLLIFLAASGGPDLEGGLPDLDLYVGIGVHRNLLSHTILFGLGAEFGMRFTIALIREVHGRLPSNHHPAWDRIQRFIVQNQRLAIGAMWAGIGAHLIQDANLFGAGTKPYVGIPGSLPMEVHQGLFIANGLASGFVGVKGT